MCFHTIQSKLAKQVERRFKARIRDRKLFTPQTHINGFEFPKTPVIIDEKPTEILHFNWGLIPSWSKDEHINKLTLNARIETLEEKPSFKNSINKRCLVIANGFYEWQWHDTKGKNKTKYEIGIANHELFAFAGIYSQWVNEISGEVKDTYSILTTEANEIMAEIHNIKKRIPIILKPEDEVNWLNHDTIDNYALPYQVELFAEKAVPEIGVQATIDF